jgi:peptidoglycan/LPS O-acetylase OafA/YrhL
MTEAAARSPVQTAAEWIFGRPFGLSERAENNLALLRFAAASAVLFAHSWPIALGAGALDPVTLALSAQFGPGVALASLAVHAFFVVSGYLVVKSALTRASVGAFAWARGLRIYPALIVNVLLSALVVGALVTSLPVGAYLASEQLWKFIGNNVLSWNVIYRLPGVFEANPLVAVNGSLWTLPLEIRCYLFVGLMLALGVLKRGWLFTLVAAALLIGDGVFRGAALLGADAAAACIGYFLIGGLFYVNRRVLPASPLFAIAALALASVIPVEPAARLVGMIGYAWLVLWIGVAAPRAPWPERLIGDPSYGIYIYAFPIQQLVVLHFGAGAPWTLAAIAGAATFVAGLLSWKLLEAPLLQRKTAIAEYWANAFKRRQTQPLVTTPSPRIER